MHRHGNKRPTTSGIAQGAGILCKEALVSSSLTISTTPREHDGNAADS